MPAHGRDAETGRIHLEETHTHVRITDMCVMCAAFITTKPQGNEPSPVNSYSNRAQLHLRRTNAVCQERQQSIREDASTRLNRLS